MLKSGNGRHRKPRQAPTAVVVVAATGAGMALPLFAASGAQAADTSVSDSTWNAVAVCESGGLWSSNTGNGFYGGLQITQETWDQYGGQDYAKRPDLASQNEQISVADEILDALGPEAWPTCADLSGLTDAVTGDDSSASADPTDDATDDTTGDTTATPSDDATDDSTTSGTDSGGTGSDTDSGSDSADASDTGDSDGTSGSASSTSPDPSATRAGSATSRNQGRHARPETTGPTGLAAWGELSRNSVKVVARTKSAATEGATTEAARRYLVRDGDSLCGIAAEEDVAGGWRALYEANKSAIGDDPSVIHPGEYLNLE